MTCTNASRLGGVAYPGATLTDRVERFEKLDVGKLIVLLSELGGVLKR